MTIRTEKISVTTTGANGSAAGNSDSPHPINGEVLALYFDFTNQPATTDTVVTTKNAPVKTLLTLTNVNTDGWYYPRAVVHDEAGTALTGTAGGDRIPHPVDDYINVAVAQGDSAKTLDVYILYRSDD